MLRRIHFDQPFFQDGFFLLIVKKGFTRCFCSNFISRLQQTIQYPFLFTKFNKQIQTSKCYKKFNKKYRETDILASREYSKNFDLDDPAGVLLFLLNKVCPNYYNNSGIYTITDNKVNLIKI